MMLRVKQLLALSMTLAALALTGACAEAGPADARADATPAPRSSGVATEPVLATNLFLENFDAWRLHIAADADERAFETIPWLPSFAAGLAAAAEQERPLLMWGMNGHPLGCT